MGIDVHRHVNRTMTALLLNVLAQTSTVSHRYDEEIIHVASVEESKKVLGFRSPTVH